MKKILDHFAINHAIFNYYNRIKVSTESVFPMYSTYLR